MFQPREPNFKLTTVERSGFRPDDLIQINRDTYKVVKASGNTLDICTIYWYEKLLNLLKRHYQCLAKIFFH